VGAALAAPVRWRGRPAAGPDAVPGWEMLAVPWRQARLCVVDLETTGLDLRRDEVVGYGAVQVRSGRIVAASAVEGLVRPADPGHRGSAAVAVHGLRPADLDGAPDALACADALLAALRGCVLVAHAAWVETAFLSRLFTLRGVRLDGPVVDTAALARATGVVRPGGGAEPGLETLALTLGVPVHPPHDALGDALTTAGVLLALVSRLERDGVPTVADLTRLTRRHSYR